MYSYIGKDEISELVQNNRKGFIVENIKTRDIDEYINNVMIVLKSRSINTTMFTQPKIKRLSDGSRNPFNKNKYTLLLTIRKDANISNNAYISIGMILNDIVPCDTIQDWMKKKYTR